MSLLVSSPIDSVEFCDYMRRYKRRAIEDKARLTVKRKFCRNLTWNRLAQDADICHRAQLVYNPSVESSNQLGTILSQAP